VNPERTVHVVLPEGFDDPMRPSGGNTYDRQLCHGLTAAGWSVRTMPVTGAWPGVDEAARRALGETLSALPDGAVVLVDGLVASSVPELLVPAARRLRLVVLMHMPLGQRASDDGSYEREYAVLSAVAAVVTTSRWSRRWLLDAYALDPGRVQVAEPGVDAAEPATGSPGGANLLCVASVTWAKGHDVLLAALTRVADLHWRCRCIGALTRAPDFVAELSRCAEAAGLADRLVVTGPRTGGELEASYAAADALVLASRAESYGMVVTEALARGLPVLASDVGGVSEALGRAPDGTRPGLLVPAGDVDTLAASLRRWLSDADLRRSLREAARQRRAGLTGWPETTDRVSRVLVGVAA
jgi:glycosyltransferase involved in cell wall biosynthesis